MTDTGTPGPLWPRARRRSHRPEEIEQESERRDALATGIGARSASSTAQQRLERFGQFENRCSVAERHLTG